MFTKRSTSTRTAVPLLRYWTWRYALILSVILFGIGFFGIYWINKAATEQQFEVLEARTELLADSYTKVLLAKSTSTSSVKIEDLAQTTVGVSSQAVTGVTGPASPAIPDTATPAANTAMIAFRVMPTVPIDHVVQIYDDAGKTFKKDMLNQTTTVTVAQLPTPAQPVDKTKEIREVVATKGATWLRVGVPYYEHNAVAGTYYVSTPLNNDLVHTYITIMVSIGIITLCGWAIVYVLSRSLTQPLRQLAIAAEQISSGNYTPSLPNSSKIKEAEISQLIHSFDDMAKRLGQLERMRTDLLAGVSHELRTPVTSIRGMIQAVKDGVVKGADADEFMQISMDEAKRLQTMVNDLLDFSSMEAGEVFVEKQSIQIDSTLNQIVAQVQTLPSFADVSVTVNPTGPEIVWIGDESHVKQILLNLLGNSAAANATQIEIGVHNQSDFLSIDVTDNGKGIPESEVPFIFERYYRGDSKRKKKQGLGLGLTISRLLAKAHNGNVELIRTSPEGTTFRLSLAHPDLVRLK
ncbi:HAMP domain-containing sensor histidine kinase [Brevibacillus sp. DP1.3A]|uniref:sensor histidine kinase n=1 Tax=Brevibacillus sp. DP1.3A TaxID=2738867 RepID=UPI00156BDB42|nr:HAMP domain-containing sensor histidine kinase [Brevibacillus sp. DP1.3A]UED75338.1 HAMP domain-containing histidine kinase [Brevibacillus sp. DP1.3A]